MINYYKIRQVLLQNVTAILLQDVTKVYYKMRLVFYYKMRWFYNKMRQLLRNAMFITNCDSTRNNKNKQSIIDWKLLKYVLSNWTISWWYSAVGYIRNHLSYEVRKGLTICKLCELESTFNAIFNLKKNKIIIWYTYKNPNMSFDEFSETLAHLWDFNINF